ncbi:potassium channel family protein [Candidatus Riflebacteria bacterium]
MRKKRARAPIIKFLRDLWDYPQVRFAFNIGIIFFILVVAIFIIEKDIVETQIKSIGDAFWWTIVTMTTVGYGDKVPLSGAGKFVAVFVMVFGTGVMAMVSGSIAGYLVQRHLDMRKGKMSLKGLSDHFIICGWKKDMPKVVGNILAFNEKLEPESIVILTNVDDDTIEEFRSIPHFRKIRILKGEPYSEKTLKRANPGWSKKVLLLADTANNISSSEADARTVMAAMTLNSHWQGLDVCAEVLDDKFDQYLKISNVSEIIYSEEYSTVMLANSVGTTGISRIIYELLNPGSSNMITTRPIPQKFIGGPYHDLREFCQSPERSEKVILLGLLENSGNRYKMKNDALREAQMSPDITLIVNNLKNVKEMEFNNPNLAPDETYLIPKHSLAILLIKRLESNHG